ncbi:hypothetical protein FRZ40_32260 [Paraburkholderia azotifigens]|uniref:DUF2188 domain-containing protein n=1 Tax=Paraburkholderia azotifigens TaxID=2057004 RepID=A0A5C6V1M3_9BURK|nr:hypothetical protein FRZ40_32260 [Paraburkholderia azotifigens]
MEKIVANNSLFINEKGTGIFTVESAHSGAPLHTTRTQAAAIAWAKSNHPDKPLHVARVRHLNDKNKPDHWRRV